MLKKKRLALFFFAKAKDNQLVLELIESHFHRLKKYG